MTDRGIIFSAPMVRALLAGRKTQTRRLLYSRSVRAPGDPVPVNASFDNRYPPPRPTMIGELYSLNASRLIKPGDRLYVREHWSTHPAFDGIAPRDLKRGSMIYTRAREAVKGIVGKRLTYRGPGQHA